MAPQSGTATLHIGEGHAEPDTAGGIDQKWFHGATFAGFGKIRGRMIFGSRLWGIRVRLSIGLLALGERSRKRAVKGAQIRALTPVGFDHFGNTLSNN
jgi:hypothetical protein